MCREKKNMKFYLTKYLKTWTKTFFWARVSHLFETYRCGCNVIQKTNKDHFKLCVLVNMSNVWRIERLLVEVVKKKKKKKYLLHRKSHRISMKKFRYISSHSIIHKCPTTSACVCAPKTFTGWPQITRTTYTHTVQIVLMHRTVIFCLNKYCICQKEMKKTSREKTWWNFWWNFHQKFGGNLHLKIASGSGWHKK